MALAAGAVGDTLTVSTGQGVVTYSGLTLKKVGGVYELVANAGTAAEASIGRTNFSSFRPILTERVLTAGKGKIEHAIGVEVSFRKELDPVLAKDMASRSGTRTTKSAAQSIGIQVVYSASPGSATLNLAGEAKSAASGQIIVVSKP